MRDCERILPVISRLAEGEASPQEALDVARHLPVCTACRILLARERRLAMLIEADLPDLPVGEGFVAAVMATLPPGRLPRRRRARRGLQLALLVGFGLGLIAIAWRWDPGAARLPGSAWPTLSPESAAPTASGLAGMVQAVWIALRAMAELPAAAVRAPADLSWPLIAVLAAAAGVLVFILAALTAGMLALGEAPLRSPAGPACGGAGRG